MCRRNLGQHCCPYLTITFQVPRQTHHKSDIILAQQIAITVGQWSQREFSRYATQSVAEGLVLFRFTFPLVQQLGHRFELRQGQLEWHPICVPLRGVLQQILRSRGAQRQYFTGLYQASLFFVSILCLLLHSEFTWILSFSPNKQYTWLDLILLFHRVLLGLNGFIRNQSDFCQAEC